MDDRIRFLEHKAYKVRVSSVLQPGKAGSGHPTTCLSAADLVVALFFYAMRFNPLNHHDPNNDRFILSKGHASALLYAVWQEIGVLTEQDVLMYRRIDSPLEGHPTFRFSRTEAATGSLGIGLSIGVGMALSAKKDKRMYYTYVLMGDSELAEGSVWEAVQLAAFYKLDNVIGIVDCNRLGQSTETMYGHDVLKLVSMFEAFGWHAFSVDGHDMSAIVSAYDEAKKVKGKPVIIIAKTEKGYGVRFVEDKPNLHGKALTGENLDKALEQLKQRFSSAVTYIGNYVWQSVLPEKPQDAITYQCTHEDIVVPEPSYVKDELVPTRKAYGQALCALGKVCDTVMSLDAEVKNSTYAQDFEAQYPDRFVQCFIAEQNMVGMGIGLALRGKKPFISTFGAFFSRAHDQIRMAAIGESTIKLVGSHAGTSIGEDGPSQMALEDIALMRALPQSIVLYPCDAVSTYHLVRQMACYNKGISYLRTTRAATPVIYESSDVFPLGGCKIIRQGRLDKICVVTAGITVFEALKAYDILALQEKSVYIAVIDAYSIKPLDVETITQVARAAGKKILVVEDHYPEGGLGEAVRSSVCAPDVIIEHLAVDRLPRSGKPEEVMSYVHIDVHAMINKIKHMID